MAKPFRLFYRIDWVFTLLLIAVWVSAWGALAAYSIFKVHEDWNAISWWFVFWLCLIWPSMKLMLKGVKLFAPLANGRISPRLAKRDLRNALGNLSMFLHTGMSDI